MRSTRTDRTRIALRHTTVLGVLALSLAVTGCSRLGGGGGLAALDASPTPLQAAPTGSVSTGALPPAVASGPGNIQPVGTPGVDPSLTGAPVDPNAVQTAALDAPATQSAAAAAPASGGMPVSENALIGNWTTSIDGTSCSTYFGLTDLGAGNMGGTRNCGGDLAKFRVWKVAGSTASLRDSTGAPVATLTRTGDKAFSGTTSSGQSFTLTR